MCTRLYTNKALMFWKSTLHSRCFTTHSHLLTWKRQACSKQGIDTYTCSEWQHAHCAVVLDQHKIQQLRTENTRSTYCCFQCKKDIGELWHEDTQVCFNFHNALLTSNAVCYIFPSTRKSSLILCSESDWQSVTEVKLGISMCTCWIVNQSNSHLLLSQQ